MMHEQIKVIIRRFGDRSIESSLLVLAVALGTGAFSSGLSLLANTRAYSSKMLESPAYRELVVSTHDNSDDMEVPVMAKPVRETAILTQSDLSAMELAPAVTFAYVRNRRQLHFVNEGTIERDSRKREDMGHFQPPGEMPEQMPDQSDSFSADRGPAEGSDPRFPERAKMFTSEELSKAKKSDEIVISEIEEADGYSVTSQFFDAWGITASAGSLFSESDLRGTDNVIILGSELAKIILSDNEFIGNLIGRKILSREGYQTIIGIINSGYGNYNENFFFPYRDRASASGFDMFRGPGMDTQLQFAVSEPDKLNETALQLSEWFSSQFGKDQIVISNPRAEAEQLVARNTGISVLILFLSMAGLFIASVNVSNILMSRTLRMKKNVGILMALGSSKRSIARLFLLEALIITGAGALLGVFLAFPLSNYMRVSLGIGTGSWVFLFIGIIVSGILTMLFGAMPARQFAKTDPAEAMREV